jgi:hypothetical protein
MTDECHSIAIPLSKAGINNNVGRIRIKQEWKPRHFLILRTVLCKPVIETQEHMLMIHTV